MNDGPPAWISFVTFLICIVMFWVGYTSGDNGATDRLKTEAVKEGHAWWRVKDSGEIEFNWNMPSCRKYE